MHYNVLTDKPDARHNFASINDKRIWGWIMYFPYILERQFLDLHELSINTSL